MGDFCGAHAFKSILGKTEDKTHCAVFTQDKMSLLPVVSLPNVVFWIYLLYRCQKKRLKVLTINVQHIGAKK